MTAYEHLALDAALHGGRDRVFEALLAHPLVGQYELARPAHRPADRAQPRPPRRGPDDGRGEPARRRPRDRRRQQQDRRGAVVGADGQRARHRARRAVPPARVGCRGRGARVWSRLVAKAAAEDAGSRAPASPSSSHVSACLANADLPVEERGSCEAAIAARAGASRARSSTTPSRCSAPGSTSARGDRRRLRRRHQLLGRASRTAAPRGSPRSATSPATGAAAATSGRRRCGGRPGPRTAAGPDTALRDRAARALRARRRWPH